MLLFNILCNYVNVIPSMHVFITNCYANEIALELQLTSKISSELPKFMRIHLILDVC